MSDLETFRDHAHNMATGHATNCPSLNRRPLYAPRRWQPTPCDGDCITDTDRALWTQLADEIDQHLARTGAPDPDLFTEPTSDEVRTPA